ncbi:MAG: serine/threonine-protein phosphatase [Firmicutes bacterium]|jgi:serine/threonine protein phosphatase PrpC|nr:serine/threonine-protein phosphatase [Bacillota bacterium]
MSLAVNQPPVDQKRDIVIEHAVVCIPKDGEELCGDSTQVISRGDATIAVLADGLGSGVKASILSTMTTRIAATLFDKGLPLDAVVDTLSSTLPVCKVRNLAYSTFTIVLIEAGRAAYLAEFDNPPAILVRDGELVELVRHERRIGDHAVTEASVELEEDDFLVVVSDGVVHAGIGGLIPLGWRWENVAEYVRRNSVHMESALDLARRLEKTCRHLYEGKPGDDATVLVMRPRRPVSLTMVVGPPEDPNDDARVAELLREASGMKVVCGGTTASLIAREWQVPLRIDLDTMSPDDPPLAHMPGVNLTTEGIITISRTLDLLKSGRRIEDRREAPYRLARLLMQADDIHFVIGRAINPAHQNPDLGGRLALKFQVIEELRRELVARGKHVRTTCF